MADHVLHEREVPGVDPWRERHFLVEAPDADSARDTLRAFRLHPVTHVPMTPPVRIRPILGAPGYYAGEVHYEYPSAPATSPFRPPLPSEIGA